MPESCSSCGELIAPPASSTSRRARTWWIAAVAAVFDAGRAPALGRDAMRQGADLTFRLGRFITGFR